jgi:acetyl-CoA synthetase
MIFERFLFFFLKPNSYYLIQIINYKIMAFKIKNFDEYKSEYHKSITDPFSFWEDKADSFQWFKKWDKVCESNFTTGENRWFDGAKLNITTNVIDRHVKDFPDKIAIIWEGNELDNESRKVTYQELYDNVCIFGNLLKKRGVNKGDRVCIYMPMIIESVYAMLACARIGAVHTVVFAGFSAQALADRINDSAARCIITADYLYRGAKTVNLREIVADALDSAPDVDDIITYKRDDAYQVTDSREVVWQDGIISCDNICTPAIMSAEDPLFILYTSGSTGKPKGVMHTIAGYMIYTSYSFVNVFNYEDGDVFWCTADIGWITGHSYMVYGPLLSAATIIMYEGVPTYPDPSRFWSIIDKYKVNIFYTAPTAIRALMQYGEAPFKGKMLNSLKTLGSVGEPINEEAWNWYNKNVGKGGCPIVDTWWQTETGGILLSALASITKTKPGYATLPLPGIEPIIVDDDGNEINEPDKTGNLCIKNSWPSIIRSTWGDHQRCVNTYFSVFVDKYFTGDGCKKDQDGNYRITGRVDDVINVSGHRIGTAEVENAINKHKLVTESAVVGFPHSIKSEAICAFVIVPNNDSNIDQEILKKVSEEIGSFAKPDKIIIVSDLPKTRSGKIMRRILRKIAASETDDFGDVSTLVNPDIVEEIKKSA